MTFAPPARPVLGLLFTALLLCRCGGGSRAPRAVADLVAITTTRLAPGVTGEAYAASIDAVGPHAPLTWRVVGGALPPGLALDAETGHVSGWPRRVGRFGFTVEVRDGPDPAAARDVSLAADVRAFAFEVRRGEIALLPIPPGPAQFNAPFVHRFEAAGGAEPYAFDLVDGDLPEGLALGLDGVLAGVPLRAGTFTPRVRAVDATGTPTERAYDLAVVVLPLGVAHDAWPDAAQGFPYATQPTVRPVGGGGPYTWGLAPVGTPLPPDAPAAGVTPLPPGLALDADSGRVAGVAAVAGTFAFRLWVRDRAGQVAHRDVTMRVNPGPVLVSVTPGARPKGGGPVTLRGSGFQPGMTASFGGGAPTPTTVLDASRASVVPPDVGRSGPVDVAVTNPDGGTYAATRAFRYPLATVTFEAEGVKGVPGTLGSSRGIAVGDVDGDGRDDVVQAWSNGLQVIRSAGAGGADVWPAANVRASGSYNDVRLADVDADGDLDLVASRSAATETIEVYLNAGDGTFPSTASTVTAYPKAASHFASSLAVGDVNADGVVDAVLTSGSGGQGTMWVHVGLGNGQWRLEHQATASIHDGILGCFAPNMVALADLDGDGRDDFTVVDAFPSACTTGVSCPATAGVPNAFPGHERLVAWTALAEPSGAPGPWRARMVSGAFGRLDGDNLGVAVYDHDGDGHRDVAVCGGYQDLRGMGIAFLAGDGAGGLVERFTKPTAVNRRYLAALDANLDGCDDVVVVGGDGRAGSFGAAGYSVAEVYLGGIESVPTLAWRSGPETSASLPGANPGRVAVGDFDGDGLPDFAVDQSFQTKERFSNDQGDGTVEGVAIYLNRSR